MYLKFKIANNFPNTIADLFKVHVQAGTVVRTEDNEAFTGLEDAGFTHVVLPERDIPKLMQGVVEKNMNCYVWFYNYAKGRSSVFQALLESIRSIYRFDD